MMHKSPVAWARGYTRRAPGEVPGTQTANYRLTDLIQRGLIDGVAARALLLDSGLVDMVWQVTWGEDYDTLDDELEDRIGNPQGYALFIHGWTGNHTIWESIPGLVVANNRRLVSIAVDHNGFGEARFTDDTPPLDTCNPPAAMRAIERLVDLLKIRRQPGDRNFKVVNFVGHSMGGAALFYLNPIQWRFGEETRLALAPALLLEDDLHRTFFTALGIGIGIVNRIRAFEVIEKALKPNVIEALCAGASDYIKRAHTLQYERTPRGITAATFTAMGLLANREIAHKWDLFRVALGHRDALVGLVPMMDLLTSLEFPAANLRVLAGTHYFFSIGLDSVFQHAQNRELVVQDILDQHERALALQKTGLRVG
jgi:pimeloyl-ACP methyl ester carboxylesterase